MFADHSELIEMANISGFKFVEDATTGLEETLLSSSTVRPVPAGVVTQMSGDRQLQDADDRKSAGASQYDMIGIVADVRDIISFLCQVKSSQVAREI